MYNGEHQTKRYTNFKTKSPNKTAHKNLRVFSQRAGLKFRLSHVHFDAKFMKVLNSLNDVLCKVFVFKKGKRAKQTISCQSNHWYSGTLSLLPPNATLSTAQNRSSYCTIRLTESLTGSLSNDESDSKDNENSKREQYRIG